MTLFDGDGSGPVPDDRPRFQAAPPSRGELVKSATLTVVIALGVGLIAVVLIGVVLVFFDIANTDPTADYQTQTGLPPIVFQIELVAVLIIAWLFGSRLGIGTPGDAIMSLTVLDTEGRPASRGANLARAGIPAAVFGVLALLDRAGLGVLLVLVLWGAALVRRDRRSVVDLLVGVVPHTYTRRRDAQPHPWAR
ncbi:MAG TPA: RDD family protein [Candidatus Nanopelagicales bacterium]|nr:RDD family protein [Candidatus Nanopelagicales bacterium]